MDHAPGAHRGGHPRPRAGWMVTVTTSITSRSDCRAFRAAGLPDVAAGHRLPDDLADFYAACGGADLFVGKEFPVRICTPDELVPSNPEIVGEQVPDDITSSWYVVARGGSGEHLSIDLHPDRLGLCYDSFVEVHGVAGSSAVVATSFTDLVRRLLAGDGAPLVLVGARMGLARRRVRRLRRMTAEPRQVTVAVRPPSASDGVVSWWEPDAVLRIEARPQARADRRHLGETQAGCDDLNLFEKGFGRPPARAGRVS